jgi:predicted RNase H-like nuclease (RuvC/YqgF family)
MSGKSDARATSSHRALLAALRHTASDLSYGQEEMAKAQAELKTLRRIDERAEAMASELHVPSSDKEEEAHTLRVELRRERVHVEMLQASNAQLQAQVHILKQ